MAFMLPVLRVVGAGLGAGAGLGVAEMITRKVGRKAREIDEDFGEGFERGMSGYYRKHISSAIEGLPADRDGARAYDDLMGEYPQSRRNQYEDEYEPEGGDGYDYMPNKHVQRQRYAKDPIRDPNRDYMAEIEQFVKRKTGMKDYVKKHSTYDGVWQGGEGLGKGRKLMGDIRGAWQDLKNLKKDWQSYDPPEDFPDRGRKRPFPGVDSGRDNLRAIMRNQRKIKKAKRAGEYTERIQLDDRAAVLQALKEMRNRRHYKMKRHMRSRAYRFGRRPGQRYGKQRTEQRRERGNI